jgi:RNA-directed DNA polymerase
MIHRAIAVKNAKREWVLDADLKSAFDKIDHNFLLERIGTFPAKEQIRGWLKAGVVDKGRYSPTDEGTPQGGVISPLLLNIALQGMEAAAGVRYEYRGDRGYIKAGCPTVVTYADDFVALCHTREQAEAVRDRLSTWLKDRGLSLNQEKTRIRRINAGFDSCPSTSAATTPVVAAQRSPNRAVTRSARSGGATPKNYGHCVVPAQAR